MSSAAALNTIRNAQEMVAGVKQQFDRALSHEVHLIQFKCLFLVCDQPNTCSKVLPPAADVHGRTKGTRSCSKLCVPAALLAALAALCRCGYRAEPLQSWTLLCCAALQVGIIQIILWGSFSFEGEVFCANCRKSLHLHYPK